MIKSLFSFEWRINRAKFFWYGLLVSLLSILLEEWLHLVFIVQNNLTESIIFLIGLLFLYPTLALIVKRYHDKNQKGLWYIIWLFSLSIINLINISYWSQIVNYIIMGLWLVLFIAYLDLLFTKWTVWNNKYGEDPIAEYNKNLDRETIDGSKKKRKTRHWLLALNLLIVWVLWLIASVLFWIVWSVWWAEVSQEPGLIEVIKQFVNRGLWFLSLLWIPGTIVGIVLLIKNK